jgi:hypothetical protein
MKNVAESFGPRICGVLTLYSEKFTAGDPGLVCKVGHTSNEAFPLRAFLAICRSSDGDELSVTVDVRDAGLALKIQADVCWDDGRMIAKGPAATVRKSLDLDFALEAWLGELKEFLHESRPSIALALATLG